MDIVALSAAIVGIIGPLLIKGGEELVTKGASDLFDFVKKKVLSTPSADAPVPATEAELQASLQTVLSARPDLAQEAQRLLSQAQSHGATTINAHIHGAAENVINAGTIGTLNLGTRKQT